MFNGIEGIPGSGKGYESTAFHVLSALKSGTLVITNMPLDVERFAAIDPAYRDLIEFRLVPQPIRGVWDKTALGTERPVFKLFEDGHTEDPPEGQVVFGGVWDYYSTWRRADGRGPLFVIDECHVPLPKLGTSQEVVQWFKQHRHFNANGLLQTQSFRDMDQAIAGLIQMLIKCRNAGVLGDPNSYIRKVHAGYRGGVVSTETRKYDPKYFGLWKSHTQGEALAEEKERDVAPLYVKINRLKWAMFAIGGVASLYAFWPQGTWPSKPKMPAKDMAWIKDAQKNAGKPLALDPTVQPVAQLGKVAATAPATSALQIGGPSGQPTATDGKLPEPYGLKGLHLLGRLSLPSRGSVYLMTVSSNGRAVSQVSDADLTAVGYSFKALGDCVATVTWGQSTRVVTCDAPSDQLQQQGRAPTSGVVEGESVPTAAALAPSDGKGAGRL